MSDPLTPIVLAAAGLKRAAPREYEAFVKSMQAYADRALRDLVAAEANVIFPAQGKAQALEQLAKKLEDCFNIEANLRR